MADWDLPTLTSLYTDVLDELKARDEDALTLCFNVPTNTPENAIRWNRTTDLFQEFISPSWIDQILALAGGGTGSATAAGARTNLGLGSMATQAASSVAITGGTIAGLTSLSAADVTATDDLVVGDDATITGTLDVGTINGNGAGLTGLNAGALSFGTVAAARLGSGTPDATKFLRGDSSWQVVDVTTGWTVSILVAGHTVTTTEINNKTLFILFGTFTVTLPDANDAGIDTIRNGVRFVNVGSTPITLSAPGSNIIGASTFLVDQIYMSLEAFPYASNNSWLIF